MSDIPTGWKCPVCGAIYAPSVTRCERCSGGEVPEWPHTVPQIVPITPYVPWPHGPWYEPWVGPGTWTGSVFYPPHYIHGTWC